VKISKKDARLKRDLAKKLKQAEKNVRLSQNIKVKDNFIHSKTTPSLEKIPRSIDSNSYQKHYFTWCISKSDIVGNWDWNESRKWTTDEFDNSIEPHMNSYISNSWTEVEDARYNGKDSARKKLNKYQSLDSLCKEAQTRWQSIEYLTQFEELFRLRLGADKRIWGIRLQHHFFLIWHERNHKICPID
jgi:hypothetical protein